MKYHLSVVGLFLFAAAALAAEPAALPTDWHGTWAGTLTITPLDGKPSQVPMTLRIEPLKDSTSLVWEITFGDGAKKQVRDYRLVPEEKANRFVIDEQNGIKLEGRLIGKTLYTAFEVGGSLLTANYTRSDDAIRFDLMSATPAKEKTGDGKVQSYGVSVVQTAELKAKK